MNKLVKTNTKLKTGDEVIVITGKDIGKKGINRFTSKNYETNNLKLTKAINAETKQAIELFISFAPLPIK